LCYSQSNDLEISDDSPVKRRYRRRRDGYHKSHLAHRIDFVCARAFPLVFAGKNPLPVV
jgi:hypothetical protein